MNAVRCMLLVATIACEAAGPDAVHDPPAAREARSPAAALREAVAALAKEARDVNRNGAEPVRLPRTDSDFAAEFAQPLDNEAVGRQMLKPAERDPFIDAYVRWQLTGFKPALPRMSDRQFERMLESLPAFAPDPKGDERRIRPLTEIAREESPRAAQLDQARRLMQQLHDDQADARTLNLPATGVRDWLRGQVDDDPVRVALCDLERLASLIDAKWAIHELTASLFEQFTSIGRDNEIATKRKEELASVIRRLGRKEALTLQDANVTDDDVQITYEAHTLSENEIRRWLTALKLP